MSELPPSDTSNNEAELVVARLQADLSDAKAQNLENRLRSVRAQIDLIKAQKELQDLKRLTS